MPRPYPKIDANPTKRFFISMLVRDIQLLEALVDLVDNSIDGARRLRSGAAANGSRYGGLRIEVSMDRDRFQIFDNCGGIDAKLAQEYAFNFGRKTDFPAVEGAVGEFGVGMKRALFKLGNHFRIESTAERSKFLIDVDVKKWQTGTEVPWEFEFKEYHPRLSQAVPEADRFTRIEVDQLHPGMADQLELGRFHNDVSVTLGEQHQASLDHGLELLVNSKSVDRRRPLLLESLSIQSVHKALTLDAGDGKQVAAELFVGLSDTGEQAQAGWYIYCNDRLVVGADKTALTGWGRTAGGTLPNYHPQYRRFRGFAFLTSDEVGLLPWNTTKTSVDPNSLVYTRLLRDMIPSMQEVLAQIDAADVEMESFPRGAGPINKAIKEATPVALTDIPTRDKFVVAVKSARGAAKKKVSVQYSADRDKMDAVRESLGGL